jgi:hypothetical protein
MLLVVMLAGVAWACPTVVQSVSGFSGKLTTPEAVDDDNTLHAYSTSAIFSPRGAGVLWSVPVQDGCGVWHSYATGPFAHNANGSVTAQGTQGRTPPPIQWTLEEIAP